MYTETQEVFDTQINAKEKNTSRENSSNAVQYQKIEDTPFTVCIEFEQDHTILIGQYRINNTPFKTMQECKDYIEKEKWNIVMTIAIIVNEIANKNNK